MSRSAQATGTPTIVFDFDGTLAVGHGPVLAYARRLAADAGPDFLERVDVALAAFDDGDATYRDGYDVVGSLASTAGVDVATMSGAYLASRGDLGTPLAPVTTMRGLDAFLASLHHHARLVLATNAPDDGIERLLTEWNVRDHFDAVHFGVGKPAGLEAVIRAALETGPVLAIGDIVEFDLAPAAALGAHTALVGATVKRFAPSTGANANADADADATHAAISMRGATLAELTNEIEAWAAAAASSPLAPHGANSIER